MNECADSPSRGEPDSWSFASAVIAAQLLGDTEATRRLIKTLEDASLKRRPVRNLVDDAGEE